MIMALTVLFLRTLKKWLGYFKPSSRLLLTLWSWLTKQLQGLKPHPPPSTDLPPKLTTCLVDADGKLPITICASECPISLYPHFSTNNTSSSSSIVSEANDRGETRFGVSSNDISLIAQAPNRYSPASSLRQARSRSRQVHPHPNFRPQTAYRDRSPISSRTPSANRPSPNASVNSMLIGAPPSSRPLSTRLPSFNTDAGDNPTDSQAYITNPESLEININVKGSDGVVRTLNAEYDDLIPSSPLDMSRYTRPTLNNIQIANVEPFKIQPMKTKFETRFLRSGWTRFAHPEGAPYFFQAEQRILTDADLFDGEIMAATERFISQLNLSGIHDSGSVDVVLDILRPEEGEEVWTCGYYLIDHANRSIFWLHEFFPEEFKQWDDVPGASSDLHVGYIIESLYWYHCSLYPNVLNLTVDIIDELRDIMFFSWFDCISSIQTTSSYSADELQAMITMTNSMRKHLNAGPGVTASICRMMYTFVEQRFLNWHGEKYARLSRDQSVYGNPKIAKRTLLVNILSPLLFVSPDIHLRQLQEIYVDGILHITSWLGLIKKLSTEWQEFILNATVLLNANVGFLAIQSVDNSTASRNRSITLILSYLSIVFSIGSIIMGLILVRQYRKQNRESASEVAGFLYDKMKNPASGIETLAILYSLPYALVMWATLSFLAAFSSLTFEHSSIVVGWIVGIAWFIVAMFILWSIITSWERHEDERGLNEELLLGASTLFRCICLPLIGIFRANGGANGVENSSIRTINDSVDKRWSLRWMPRLRRDDSAITAVNEA